MTSPHEESAEADVEMIEVDAVVEVAAEVEADVDADAESESDVLVLDEAPDPDSVLPMWEPTGNPAVDSALEDLHSLQGADLTEHAATYEGIERSLRGTLDTLAAEDEPA